jgi:FMN-dependent oxidoreductase (nitrilotriacetate monooxygenase family)
MPREDPMRLGALFYGFGGDHPSGWRHPSSAPWHPMDVGYSIHLARVAEAAKLDTVFFADSAGTPDGERTALARAATKSTRIDPLVLIAALAGATERIGIAATASTTYYEPYNLARLIASVDHLSGGRAGWNVVTSDRDEMARNFGDQRLPDNDERYDRAEEFVDVAFGLWDSWEEDPFVLERDGGYFYDPDKMHKLHHRGERFAVEGPLNVPRTPQGRPVIAQAGASGRGLDFAASVADAVFSAARDLDTSQDYYRTFKAMVESKGRAACDVKVLEGCSITVAETRAEAQARIDWLVDRTPYEVGLWSLTEHLGVDLRELDPDKVPTRDQLPERAPGSQALFDALVDFILSHGTMREVVRERMRLTSGRGVVGSATDAADYLQERFEAETCDGFMLMFPVLPLGLEEVRDHLVPELQRRGLFRTDYAGTTLRDHLGVPVPANRHTGR